MTCEETRERLSAWLDDALAREERARVDEHLAGCADCGRELERLRHVVALLQSLPPERAPVGFVDRVLASVHPEPWPRRVARWLIRPLHVKLPIEAVAVAAVAVVALWVYRETPEVRQASRLEERRPPVVAAPPPPAPLAAPPAAVAPRATPAAPGPELPAKREPGPASPRRSAPAREPAEGAKPVEGATPAELEAAGPSSVASLSKEGSRSEVAPRPDGPPRLPPAPPQAAAPPPAGALQAPASMAAPPGAPEARDEAQAKPEAPGVGAEVQAQSQAKARVAPAPDAMALRSLAGQAATRPEVSGRLVVADRVAARRALAELVRAHGGRELSRPGTADETVEVFLPGSAYREFAKGLARLGQWLPDREPADLPAEVRVVLRLGS